MAFTYDLSTDIGKMRLRLGDFTPGAGVKPSGENFTDEELQSFLDEANQVQRACAVAADVLANLWTTAPKRISDGETEVDRGDVAKAWAERAKQWRASRGPQVLTPRVYGVSEYVGVDFE